jgi:ABC-type Fe3+/spermidine/putrescine transport system ATPase subunit
LVRRKQAEGVTIIIATHDPGEAIAVADRRIDLSS